jgi:hypothetical protein
VPLWSFTIGDVFDADDPLAVWAATLGLAFNDLVHANTKVEKARTEWERFYEWRIATGHYNEACLHLIRSSAVPEVQRFLASEPKVHELHEDTLHRYESLKRLTNRVRNEAAFHYGQPSARALRRARHESSVSAKEPGPSRRQLGEARCESSHSPNPQPASGEQCREPLLRNKTRKRVEADPERNGKWVGAVSLTKPPR